MLVPGNLPKKSTWKNEKILEKSGKFDGQKSGNHEMTNEKLPYLVKWTFVMESCQQHSNLFKLNPLEL